MRHAYRGTAMLVMAALLSTAGAASAAPAPDTPVGVTQQAFTELPIAHVVASAPALANLVLVAPSNHLQIQEHTMAESIREGGVYRVGDKWLTAEGKETKAPSRAELQKSGERRTASTTVSSEPFEPEFNEDFPSFKVLYAAGIDSLDAVRSATDEQLLALDGIGDASLKKIREAQGE